MNTDLYKNATVLITGASSGIGKAFARSLAKVGARLILVARSEKQLNNLADELRRAYRSSIYIITVDLSLSQAPQQLFGRIKASGLSVDILINNAGFGKWSHFLGESIGTYQRMLSLNNNALLELTYLYLPDMLARNKGGVLNISSTAAFQPIPYQAVYAASKAFVLSFTEALAGEYQKSDVRIMALCPGNTATNFMSTANANTEGMSFATPEAVAMAGLVAFSKRKSYLVHGLANYLNSLLPRILTRNAVITIVAGMFKNRVPLCPVGQNEMRG